jgi:protein phosphatase
VYPIESNTRSDVGLKRKNNEDSVGSREPTDAQVLAQSGCLYVVADGLGGYEGGERASSYAVEHFIDEYYRRGHLLPEVRMREIVQEINTGLRSQAAQDPQLAHMATTIVIAVIRNDALVVANVGDSRAYLLRDGHIRQLTRDHSVVGEMVRSGAMTEEEAQQSSMKNRLTRGVGVEDQVTVDVYPAERLEPGDVVLLCSDGLTHYADRPQLEQLMREGTPQEIGERLIGFANSGGGIDNTTVAVIRIGGTPGKRRTRKQPVSIGKQMLQIGAAFALGATLACLLTLMGGLAARLLEKPAAALPPDPTRTEVILPPSTTAPPATDTPAGPSITLVAPTTTLTPAALTETATVTAEMTVTPDNGLIICAYSVRSGEILGYIAVKFDVDPGQITREGGEAITNPDQIEAGEILWIHNITPKACQGRYGTPVAPTTTP